VNELDPIRFVDQRLGAAPLARKALKYVFPDHWSFMLGEIALYCFGFLVVTGIYLALFFEPSLDRLTYTGSYAALRGEEVSAAYNSALRLSFDVPAGLLIRQAHHWAANVFLVAIVLHLMRVFFTGAFRKPRELNWTIGVTMLGVALLEGYAGYSLLDDLLSGMGLAIGYSVANSIPLIGGDVAHLIWGGEFPGAKTFISRVFIAHVLLLPALLAGLVMAHLALIMRQRHTQFRGRGVTERRDVGTPLWPGYALRSAGLLAGVAAVLFLLGGLVQINPIWQWGPYEIYNGENGAQPDWYLGWLIGALRLVPSGDVVIGSFTVIPNPFWGGLLFPLVVFALLYTWPLLEQRFITRDTRRHELLDRPRDNPLRTAIGVSVLVWIVGVFAFGAADRILVNLGISYGLQLDTSRIGVWVIPAVAFAVTYRTCRRLRDGGGHPLRGSDAVVIRRRPDGAYVADAPSAASGGADGRARSSPPTGTRSPCGPGPAP
jgi:ubiquinol-cytochrome c reductase cytochrome b subunit